MMRVLIATSAAAAVHAMNGDNFQMDLHIVGEPGSQRFNNAGDGVSAMAQAWANNAREDTHNETGWGAAAFDAAWEKAVNNAREQPVVREREHLESKDPNVGCCCPRSDVLYDSTGGSELYTPGNAPPPTAEHAQLWNRFFETLPKDDANWLAKDDTRLSKNVLHKACEAEGPSGIIVLKRLLTFLPRNAILELLHEKDETNKTPLLHAGFIGDAERVKALFDKLQDETIRDLVQTKDVGHETLLHYSASFHDVEVVKVLRDYVDADTFGALLGEKEFVFGSTPLHQAAQVGGTAVLTAMLTGMEAGTIRAFLEKTDEKGRTPRNVATEEVKQLLDELTRQEN